MLEEKQYILLENVDLTLSKKVVVTKKFLLYW